MPESPLVEKEVAALTDLEALIAARAKGETETELVFHRRREKEDHEYRTASRQLSARYKAEKAALEAEYQRTRDEILQAFERENQAVEAEYSQVKQKIEAQSKTERSRAKKAHEETRWQALAMYEAARDGSVKSRKRDEEMLATTRADFENVRAAADPGAQAVPIAGRPGALGNRAAGSRRAAQARGSRCHRSWRDVAGVDAARGREARR